MAQAHHTTQNPLSSWRLRLYCRRCQQFQGLLESLQCIARSIISNSIHALDDPWVSLSPVDIHQHIGAVHILGSDVPIMVQCSLGVQFVAVVGCELKKLLWDVHLLSTHLNLSRFFISFFWIGHFWAIQVDSWNAILVKEGKHALVQTNMEKSSKGISLGITGGTGISSLFFFLGMNCCYPVLSSLGHRLDAGASALLPSSCYNTLAKFMASFIIAFDAQFLIRAGSKVDCLTVIDIVGFWTLGCQFQNDSLWSMPCLAESGRVYAISGRIEGVTTRGPQWKVSDMAMMGRCNTTY